MPPFETILVEAQRAARGTAMKVLRSRHPDDVEDVLQNAAIKAWRFRENFRGDAQFKTYFCRIVINEALMHLRHENCRAHESLDERLTVEDNEMMVEPAAEQPTPEQMAYAAEINAAMKHAISQMPPLVREEGLLFLNGDTGSSENARKARRFRARLTFKKVLRERGIYAA
jgi:RNA polymerase sigma factor (sigma-70 family)